MPTARLVDRFVETTALQAQIERLRTALRSGLQDQRYGSCGICGEEDLLEVNHATDDVPLCGACWALFKAAGLLPFVPAAQRCQQAQWIAQETERLAGRRLGNGHTVARSA